MIGFIGFMVAFVAIVFAAGWVIHTGMVLLEGLKPVTAGVYMYVAPWVENENRYHPSRLDRKNLLVSKFFWTVAAARKWVEEKHAKYCAGEQCPTVTTVAFVQYSDWEDLLPAAQYYVFPENFGTNESVWRR